MNWFWINISLGAIGGAVIGLAIVIPLGIWFDRWLRRNSVEALSAREAVARFEAQREWDQKLDEFCRTLNSRQRAAIYRLEGRVELAHPASRD